MTIETTSEIPSDVPSDMPSGLRSISVADIATLDFDKGAGLIPAIVQHAGNGAVLMLGYMNREALTLTFERRRLVFFSRKRQRLWEKGESSGHFLALGDAYADCDADTLLFTARPNGPACHLGTASCFGDGAASSLAEPLAFLSDLERVIAERSTQDPQSSYTARLLAAGARRIAQKVGEEGVETALAGAAGTDLELINESADLLYHVLVLLRARRLSLAQVCEELRARHAVSGRDNDAPPAIVQ